MPDVIADPLDPGFNSYSSEDDADLYFEGRLYSSEWTTAVTSNKEASLIMATNMIDDYMLWQGRRTAQDQPLQWPRTGVVDQDGYPLPENEVPSALKFATIEMALFLLKDDRLADDTLGIGRVKAGSLDVTFDKNDRRMPIPDSVASKLRFLGKQRKSKSMMVGLVRT